MCDSGVSGGGLVWFVGGFVVIFSVILRWFRVKFGFGLVMSGMYIVILMWLQASRAKRAKQLFFLCFSGAPNVLMCCVFLCCLLFVKSITGVCVIVASEASRAREALVNTNASAHHQVNTSSTHQQVNTSTSQHINTSTHQHINTSTHQHINRSTSQHINTSIHQHINTSTHQHINTSTHQHINTSTHQHINTSTHQHINTSVYQHINTSTHQVHQHINRSTYQHINTASKFVISVAEWKQNSPTCFNSVDLLYTIWKSRLKQKFPQIV